MPDVHERLYIEAPYTQAVGAFERGLGFAPGGGSGESVLTIALPTPDGREIARIVTATTERLPNSANYTSQYHIAWATGRTARGIPTPGFSGSMTLGAGEDYGETELKLEGRYDPPGGVVGRAFDELVGRRIAHATLSALLSRVGEQLRAAHELIEAEKHIH